MSSENYQLVVRKGPKPGQVYPLLAPTVTVGRDPMSDIVLNDPEVSRYHAQLMETVDGYTINDMGSTNGTYISGKRIDDEPVLLQAGQDVAFGSGIFLMYELANDEVNPFEDMPFDDAYEPATAVADQFSSPSINQSPTPPLPDYENSPPPPAQPLVFPADDEAAQKRKRLITIVVAAIVLLCLCCILTVVGMYYWGADWILQQLGAQAASLTVKLIA